MFGSFQFLKCGVVNFGNNGLDIFAVGADGLEAQMHFGMACYPHVASM